MPQVGCLLLICTFFFDIFWVFLSPLIFKKSVMIEAPIERERERGKKHRDEQGLQPQPVLSWHSSIVRHPEVATGGGTGQAV